MLTNKRIVVTGGLGFIGSNLVNHLCGSNEVKIIDNMINGELSHINQGQVVIINKSILDNIHEELLNADYVFHFAANASMKIAEENPLFDLQNNVLGTLNLLESCIKANVSNFIYSSSSAVYGNISSLNINEKEQLQPVSNYGISKLAAEHYVSYYGMSGKINTISLRYFNVYGNNQKYSEEAGVITIFKECIEAGKPVRIFGDGNQTRDYIHVSDVVKANVLAAENCEKYSGEIFNIGTGIPTKINELVKYLGIDNIICENERAFDVYHNCADINKAEHMLTFRAQVNIENGLNMLVKAEV